MLPIKHPKIFHDVQGNLLLNFGQYGHDVGLAAFSGDGTMLLTVQQVGTASIHDLSTGELICNIRPTSSLEGKKGLTIYTAEFRVFIEAAALNPDGTHALLGLNDGTAGIFSTASGERLSTFPLAQMTQPGETSLAVPPPVWEGYALGQRLAFDFQCPYTQRQADILAGHNLVTFWLEECFDQLCPSGCAKDDHVLFFVQPQVFQDNVPCLLI